MRNLKRSNMIINIPSPYAFSWMNINHLDQLNSNKYPEIKLLIDRLQAWDRRAEANSLGSWYFCNFL